MALIIGYILSMRHESFRKSFIGFWVLSDIGSFLLNHPEGSSEHSALSIYVSF